MTEYYKEKFYDEYAIKKGDTTIAIVDSGSNARRICDELNNLHEENLRLKKELKDCEKLKTKRLNKIRNHRAVIEDLGGSIRAYKGKLSQANEKIDKIKEAMEDTGALTKRQLEEILDD